VIIFLRNAPFTDLFKILFIFGYFMFYEYNIISRNYGISFFMLFISFSLFCAERKNYSMILLSLLILSFTHLFSFICAISLLIITILMYKKDEKEKISEIKFGVLCS